jgi:hypothetical protein
MEIQPSEDVDALNDTALADDGAWHKADLKSHRSRALAVVLHAHMGPRR